MFLQNALQKTIQAVRRHKLLFLALFLTQIIFIVLIAVINLKYQLAIVENLKNVVLTLETANYNETLIQMGTPFLENPYQVYQSYESIWSNLKFLLGFSFLAFIIFENFSWAISLYMLKKQNFAKLYGKTVLISLVLLIPATAVIYLILKTAWESNLKVAINFSIFILIIVAYFLLVSFSLASHKIKEIFRLNYRIGIKKADPILFTLMLCLVVFSLIGGLMYSSVVWPFYIMVLLIVLFIITLVAIRIFIISSILELS